MNTKLMYFQLKDRICIFEKINITMKKILTILFLLSLTQLYAQSFLIEEHKTIDDFTGNPIFLKFSPQHSYFTVNTADSKVFLYNQNFQKIWSYEGSKDNAAGRTLFTSDEKYMLFSKYQGMGDIALMRLSDKRVIQRLKAHSSYSGQFKFSPDEKYLISGGNDGKLLVWEWNAEEESFTEKQTLDLKESHEVKDIKALVFAPDGKMLFAAGYAKDIFVFSFKKGELTLEQTIPHKPRIYDIQLHPDGEQIVIGSTEHLLTYEIGKNKLTRLDSIRVKGNNALRNLSFDKEGYFLSIPSYNGFQLFEWNNGSPELYDKFDIHDKPGIAALFSPDENYFVTSSTDLSLKVWLMGNAPDYDDIVNQVVKGDAPQNDQPIEVQDGDLDLDFDPNDEGTNYLLMIAINDYQYWNPLLNATKDAGDVKDVLKARYGFEDENIVEIYNEEATSKNILGAFTEMIETIEADDNLMIYFSGHGYYNTAIQEGYWIPVDAHKGEETEYLANASLLKYLKALKAKHVFLVADACFSGSLFADGTRGYVETVAQHKSRWGLTSGRLEFVSDGSEGGNSPFASYFIKFLQENTKAQVPVSEIVHFVKVAVANNSEQTPIGNPLKGVGDEGGEFIFNLQE